MKVLSSVEAGMVPDLSNPYAATSEGTIEYSLDNGATWITALDTAVTSDKQYLSVSLPATQNLAQVQVRATCSSYTPALSTALDLDNRPTRSSMTLSLYEIRVEVTQ
jgi:hypothetical protein